MLPVTLALRRNLKPCSLTTYPYLTRTFSKSCSLWALARKQPGNYFTQERRFSTSPYRKSTETAKNEQINSSETNDPALVYNGPLSRTFRSLKIFSMSSLGLAVSLTPFMFIIETSLPFVAKVVLASTAVVTSTVSTALVAWCGKPYVSTIRLLTDSSKKVDQGSTQEGFQIETFDLALRSRFTNVYDPAFITETRRPFAKWELAEQVSLGKPGDNEALSEEVVAETLDRSGKVLGQWIVSWDEKGTQGTCRAKGKIQRSVVQSMNCVFS